MEVDLGTGIILDAKSLMLGRYVEIDGLVLKVICHDTTAVKFSIVTGFELFFYRFKKWTKQIF